MKVQFFLRNGGVVEWPVPEGEEQNFNFPLLVKMIRGDNYFLQPNCYIPHGDIVCMGFDSSVAVVKSVQPAHTTKQ